jgi:[protein-PII] uridylyltransferase
VLDSFVVIEGDGAPVAPGHRLEEIRAALRKVLADPAMTVVEVNRRTPARLRHFTTPTTIFFSQDRARHRTLLELVTADRPGLLSWIGRVFHRRGILLDAAKVNTVGERAEDVFFITDRDHKPIEAEEVLDELREVLTRTLNRGDFVTEDFHLTAPREVA